MERVADANQSDIKGDVSRTRTMNNYELDEEAKLLEDTYSSYALARMYLDKCLEVEKLLEERETI